MRYRTLGKTGLELSVLGFGAAPLGSDYGTVDTAEAQKAVHTAIDRGINFFDSSPYYGLTVSETRLGAALAGKRQQVILCTKCGRYDRASFDFSAARVKASIDESLTRLQTDYLDMFIAHDIEFGDREQVVHETIPAMRELQKLGKARFIGVSGLPLKILADVAERTNLDFVLSYCRYSLLNRDLDKWLIPVARERQMGIVNASPLHMRILAPEGPAAWHPAPETVKEAGAKIVKLCQERGVDPAVAATSFSLGHPYVSSTLIGMMRVAEVEANLKALDFQIDPELGAGIETIAAPVEEMLWPSGRPENDD